MKRPLLLPTLALLSVFPPLATDMYLPGLHALAASLNASDAAAELSLSLFFLGLCVGQLVYGPLIDRLGRRGPLLAGVVLFCLSTVALVCVSDIRLFNALRFLQATGACAGMIVGRAIVTDLYKGREAAQAMTVLIMLMTLGPVIAPSVGSLLIGAFGWQACFFAMLACGVMALTMALRFLPETLPPDARETASIGQALRGYAGLLRDRGFLCIALAVGLVQAGMFAFITASAGLFTRQFGLSGTGYGIAFGAVAAALLIASRINSALLSRQTPQRLVSLALPLLIAAGVGLLAVSQTRTVWVLIVPLWLAIGLIGALSANLMAMAMEAARGRAGIGSALIGAIQFALAFTVSSLVALASGSDWATSAGALPLTLGILLPALVAAVLWFGPIRRLSPAPA